MTEKVITYQGITAQGRSLTYMHIEFHEFVEI